MHHGATDDLPVGEGGPACGIDPKNASRPSIFVPGSDWLDVEGHPIEAHTGGIFCQGSTFYWVGARWKSKDWFQAFNLYSSLNLEDWRFTKTLLLPSADLPASHEIARPKILYNSRTSTYVMWFKRKNFSAATNDVRVGVAIGESIEGPWSFHRDFFAGEGGSCEYNTADLCLWQEPDGEAFLVASSPSRRGGAYERRIVIFRLSLDYRGVEPEPVYVGPADDREAPALFKRDKTYYLITSATTGWAANQCTYRTASAIQGPWSERIPLGNSTTFDTQPDFVFSVSGDVDTTYVYAGGRHVANELEKSRYVWLPLEFSGEQMTLAYRDKWSLDVQSGLWKDSA